MSDDLPINRSLTIPAAELSWTAVRASGPGGQNVNKVASKVELRFDVAGSAVLFPSVKARLRALAGNRFDADGRLVITSQVTRDQSRNLEEARQRLAELVRRALVRPKPRVATKPTKGSQRRRLDDKKRVGQRKADRRKSWD